MKPKRLHLPVLLVALVVVALVAACAPAPAAPQAPAAPAATPATTQAPAAAPAAEVVNRAGVKLPADAAPLDQQVLKLAASEQTWNSWDASVYDLQNGAVWGVNDSCARMDLDLKVIPNACEKWETSEDGLTWTFSLDKDRVWSDGTPLTADDWVFTLQRYARPDYDFEWFYGMAGIQNWSAVVKGEKPPEELGVKKVDDYTFTVTTDTPNPFLINLFTMVFVAPKHIVKDRLADGSWALDPKTAVSAGPYKLEAYNKGKDIVWVANDKYTGPFPPLMDKIIVSFIDPQARFNAYQNGELDILGQTLNIDLPPAAMAQIMSDPGMKKQLIQWPNFNTYYLFFDTWNAPFDDVKVRQAFSHAIDRTALVNGPLQYQGAEAYSMNPPGFPGENVAELKNVQNYDPAQAKQLMADAGYPDGKGFSKLVLYTREANPALTNAAEAILAMLKENLGVEAEVQDLDYKVFMEKMRQQKKDGKGDMAIGLVPYEFDFVDGSNMLSVWGGCDKADTLNADAPGRHTWRSKEYNDLMCQAQTLVGDEAKRNELYKQAEKILVSDVGLVPLYHSILNVLVHDDIKGPALDPNSAGVKTFWRHEFTSGMSGVYRAQK
jgi:ABC-type transport system substrate-binding protein